MLGLRTPEILLIVVAIFLLFGASRLPQLAKSLGHSRKAFKDAFRDADEQAVNIAESPKQIATSAASSLSDAEILAEMQRRTEARAEA